MNKVRFDVDSYDTPITGTLTYVSTDIDAADLENFHDVLDALTHKTFPSKYEAISVEVTGRTYDGQVFSIVKCDKIFDDGDVFSY